MRRVTAVPFVGAVVFVLFVPFVESVPFVGVYKPQNCVKPRAQALSAPFPGDIHVSTREYDSEGGKRTLSGGGGVAVSDVAAGVAVRGGVASRGHGHGRRDSLHGGDHGNNDRRGEDGAQHIDTR